MHRLYNEAKPPLVTKDASSGGGVWWGGVV